MEFSTHYPPFQNKTLIALTNTEGARILAVIGREVEELDGIHINVPEESDFDAYKAAQLEALGKKLSKRFHDAKEKEGYIDITLCVPEVNREQLVAAIDPKIIEECVSVISKNLCAMKLDVIMRILLEG